MKLSQLFGKAQYTIRSPATEWCIKTAYLTNFNYDILHYYTINVSGLILHFEEAMSEHIARL